MVSQIKRVILIVLDSVGMGAMPDAEAWGDEGSNTLGNIDRAVGGLALPNMGRLGLGNLVSLAGTPAVSKPTGAFGRMAIASHGKDTMTGHWEMVGIRPTAPFRTYPDGFPQDLLAQFCERSGIGGILGNTVASGTEIIKDLGEAHLKTGWPIVYTSADSVFQVAAHEERFGLARLYEICEVARAMLQPPHQVGRVIARPFVGTDRNNFKRTSNRHDYAIVPPAMLLDNLKEAGYAVLAVGKISDIFTGNGITWSESTANNQHGLRSIHAAMAQGQPGLIFANLVDFDMLYGHRRDVQGFAQALIDFDQALPGIFGHLTSEDALIVTADHGNDPTHHGTDHTREYVPVLICGDQIKPGVDFGCRSTLADLGATIAELLGTPYNGAGTSFASQIRK